MRMAKAQSNAAALTGLDPEILADMESPLGAALKARDQEVLAMVRHAVETGSVLLAYQPVVQAGDPDRVAFHEGLIRILDPRMAG
jgi:hypothetical protein